MARPKKGAERAVNLPRIKGIQDAQINPCKGLLNKYKGQSLIEMYGLGGFIREQRMKGKSVRAITDLINEGKMLPNDYKIAHSTIASWCQDNGCDGSVAGQSEYEAINVYEREVKMLKIVNKTMDMLMTKMDDMSQDIGNGEVDVKEMKMMVDMVSSMSIRQQALTQDIGRLQERIYNYQMVSDAFQVIADTLARELDAPTYRKVIKAITARPALREALRPITPAGAT
jgi:hypothetical protein